MIRRPSSVVTLQKSDVNEFDALRFALDTETRTKAEERLKEVTHATSTTKSETANAQHRQTDKSQPSSARKRRKVYGHRMTTRQRLGIDELPSGDAQTE
ncbi:hypothetical protein EC973_008367 [Apophysomyces ossiformis]|uniref:Uncharacterized protein n=1 Tax=Apophysomyces ossiformis TaxID=679940 RepID=A0A8H7BQQ7_9FUNG|nr:hypothetical protein EC973_008367 [Apophysomyces ossiformis]